MHYIDKKGSKDF